MKAGVIFFLSLLFCLAGRSHFAYSAPGTSITSFQPSHVAPKVVELTGPNTIEIAHVATDPQAGGNDYLVGVEEDSEDDIVRKHILPRGYFLAVYYAFIADYFPASLRDQLSLYSSPCNTDSCKYITQRVLRI
jgi:hypothetical protein